MIEALTCKGDNGREGEWRVKKRLGEHRRGGAMEREPKEGGAEVWEKKGAG